MKQILLAINGPEYRKEAIRYALGLARRVKAQLAVLQVVDAPHEEGGAGLGSAIAKGARAFQRAMVETAYAEAGEHDTALQLRRELDLAADRLAKEDGGGVDYRVTVTSGRVEEEVSKFVREHPEAVLAVYDGPRREAREDETGSIGRRLPIPLVSLAKKDKRSGGLDMSEPVAKKKSEVVKAAEKFEKYNEAVAYAEGNMPEEAVRIMEEITQSPSLLLVLGRGHGFSCALKDYSVELAKRLGYEIVAVSNKYIPQDFLPLVSQYREKLREDFTKMAAESAAEFEEQCELSGVPFRHVVKFGEATDILKELNREFTNLDYVVSEPSTDVQCEPGTMPAIPVFSLKVA